MSGSTKAVAQRISVFADSRGNTCSEEDDSEGRYVLFTDHEQVVADLDERYRGYREAAMKETSRLRAELKEVKSERDGLIELANRSAGGIRKANGEYNRLSAEADALRAGQKLVGYRWRHSAGEKWKYSDIPCGWEYEPLYAAMGADA